MMMSFLTAALLMGVQGVQELAFTPPQQGTTTTSANSPGWGQRIQSALGPASVPASTEGSQNFPQGTQPVMAQAGGAGGTASSSAGPAPSQIQPPLPSPPRPGLAAHLTGEFVPAAAQLSTLLNPLPERIVQVIVDLSDRHVYLYKGTEQIGSYPVAIGKDGWETPTGRFQVIDMQVDPHWQHPITRTDVPPGPGNPLGSRWVAFLPMQDGVIGFHGTYQTDLIGQAVSHGCIRMQNADIEAMYQHLAPGVPVIVRQ
ncbi:L,D-transpeptidase [Leptolyngbya sp. FACHB-8]